MLVVNGENRACDDRLFTHIVDFLVAGDVLVFNDTRVIPARLFGQKITGGRVEVLIDRIMPGNTVLAHVRASKSPKVGARLILGGKVEVEVLNRHDGLFELVFLGGRAVLDILSELGHVPLPPYVHRPDEGSDIERYQTVYANVPGAVAAPTAGLHFDEPILEKLREKGVEMVFVTLHVGSGTFQPVRVDDLNDHRMHAEYVDVSEEACQKINAARDQGRRVIAVGTTSVRSLESAAKEGRLEPFMGETRLFITPGYQFQMVDMLITNFHLPESTLLMLVSAFSGYSPIMAAYEHAITQEYRFFSYGDAMLLFPDKKP